MPCPFRSEINITKPPGRAPGYYARPAQGKIIFGLSYFERGFIACIYSDIVIYGIIYYVLKVFENLKR